MSKRPTTDVDSKVIFDPDDEVTRPYDMVALADVAKEIGARISVVCDPSREELMARIDRLESTVQQLLSANGQSHPVLVSRVLTKQEYIQGREESKAS